MASITTINGLNLVAQKLLTARDIAIAGDATGTASFDGSANITITATLANTSAARTNLGLGTVATLDTGVAAGNVPILDENGKLAVSTIPSIGITDVFVKTDITATTEEEALAALKTYVAALDAQQGDLVIFSYTWTSPAEGVSSGTIILTADYEAGDTEDQKWAKWVALRSPDSETLDTLVAQVAAHIGSNGVAAHALATTTAAGFMPPLTDVNATTSFLAGDGTWINHVGLGGDVHATVTTDAAGFIPALPANGAGQYFDGTGAWTPLPVSSTSVATTGATPGQFVKVGNHWCVALTATEAVAAGVVTYGTALTVGADVYVSSEGVVSYTAPTDAGTFFHVGYVVSATEIELSATQTEYVLV